MEVSELSELLGARDIKAEQCYDGPEDPLSIVNLTGDAALGLPTVEMLAPLTVLEEHQDEDTVQSTDSSEDVIVQLMDIRTRLSTLRTMLERRLGTSLASYTFWLQDAKELESHKTLVDQCIKGEGVVQVNLQVQQQGRRINILDVLKPDEELVDLAPGTIGEDDMLERDDSAPEVSMEIEEIPPSEILEPSSGTAQKPLHSTMVRWIVDQQFQSERLRLKIPEEPADWSVAHVRLWIQWAVRQFNLTGIKLPDWTISGEELSAMTLHEFREKCPSDPGDIFWTHFELLRKCKFIAVVQNEDPSLKEPERQFSVKKKKPQLQQSMINCDDAEYGPIATRGGSNGQIHLWQFLLELLTTAAHLPVIQWQGPEGEFKLCDPERVARLWGIRKHKPAMNYEKLSRALRYYYDGDMIAKVNGKRFVYKFVCDLRMLVGYDAAELARLVRETRAQELGEEVPGDA